MAIVSITRDQIDTILSTAGTNFLSVTFKKKDGSLRNLAGHLKVTKHLKGGESTISHIPDLVPIYDIQNQGYRCFDKNRLLKMRVNGNIYNIKD